MAGFDRFTIKKKHNERSDIDEIYQILIDLNKDNKKENDSFEYNSDKKENNPKEKKEAQDVKGENEINSIQLIEEAPLKKSSIDYSEKEKASPLNNLEENMRNYSTEGKNNYKRVKTVSGKKPNPKPKKSKDNLVRSFRILMNEQSGRSSVNQQLSKSNKVFLMNPKFLPNKEKRFDKDKKNKFNLETTNKDYFNKIKIQCKSLFTEEFWKKILGDDCRGQVDAYKEMKYEIDKKINIQIYFDNLDLILKIIGIKMMNNLNPTLTKNCFEFLGSLYAALSENKYKLNEIESNIIINILIEKLSLNNNTLREILFSLLNIYIDLMDTNKIMITVINLVLNKNLKIKMDILDLIYDLTINQKLNLATKVYIKLLCKFFPCIDNIMRNKILSLFREIYSEIGNKMWNMIDISEKDQKFLEDNLFIENEEENEEEDELFTNEEQENFKKDKRKNEKVIISNKNEIKEKNSNNNEIILHNKKNQLNKEDLLALLDNLFSKDLSEK